MEATATYMECIQQLFYCACVDFKCETCMHDSVGLHMLFEILPSYYSSDAQRMIGPGLNAFTPDLRSRSNRDTGHLMPKC